MSSSRPIGGGSLLAPGDAARRPDGGASPRRDRRDHQEEIRLGHGAPETPEEPGENVAGQRGRKPEPPTHDKKAGGGHFPNQGQPDGREVDFADGGNGEIAAQP